MPRYAFLVIDGDLETFSHTTFNQNSNWVKVGLLENSMVSEVTFWRHSDCCFERNRYFHIEFLEDSEVIADAYQVDQMTTEKLTFRLL